MTGTDFPYMTINQFAESEASQVDRSVMGSEFATRSSFGENIFGMLPDPDPILRKAGIDIATYRELMSDPHVWSCYTSRTGATLSRDFETVEATEGGTPSANAKALEVVNLMWSRLRLRRVVTDILSAPMYGMAPMEMTCDEVDGYWLPMKFEGKPPEWFGFGDANELLFKSKDNPDGAPLPPMKFILATHRASYRNPFGQRVLSRCFWPVTFKRGGIKFWNIFLEKYGMPHLVGKVPRSTGEPERAALRSALVSMVQDAVAVINNDESVDFKESAFKASSANVYEGSGSFQNREISKAMVGQTLSTELDKGGSLAATQGHLEVREDIADDDTDMVVDVINELHRRVTLFNVPQAAPPIFRQVKEESVQKDRAERDEKLVLQGVRLKKSYYVRTYSLQEDEFDLADPGAGEVPPDGGATEFAEGGDASETERTLAALQAAVADETGFDPMIDIIRKAADQAEDYDDLKRRIKALLPELSDTEITKRLARMRALADMAGRADAAK